jgi:hypothetical protein
MAKIDRYNGNMEAFAADALSTERTIFGDTTQSDTLDANITVDFLRGWGVVGVNENPTKQDFNGLAFTLGQLIAYLHQRGIAEWNTNQEYFEGSVVTTLAGIYRLKTGGDGSIDPDIDGGVNWELMPTQAKVDAKADQATTYTETEVDSLLDDKADQATTYTETEVDGLLDDKANISGQIFTGEINYRGAGGDTTNTGYGENVLQNNTTGSDNTASGRSALFNNITGSDNTANGKFALVSNTEGNSNTASGMRALYSNTEGNNNTANGRSALTNNITGIDNTANGYNTGLGIETGSGNSIFGANVTGLAPDLTDNLILASGGVIRLQHDGVGTTTVQGDLVADNLSGTNTGDQVLSEIGVGQTWHDVTGSRSDDVTYTNSSGKPIFISVTTTDTVGYNSAIVLFVNGSVIAKTFCDSENDSNAPYSNITAIIPNGSTYKATKEQNDDLDNWWELR